MAIEESGHLLWVGPSRIGQGFRREQTLIKPLWGAVREHGNVDHRRAPLLTVGRLEQQPQPSDGAGLVCLIRQTAAQRKPTDQRNVPRLEDCCPADGGAGSGARERSGGAETFGMVAPKPVMAAVDIFEAIGEPGRGQGVWSQPAAGISEPAHIHRGDTSDRTDAQQRAPASQRTEAGTGGLGLSALVRLYAVLF